MRNPQSQNIIKRKIWQRRNETSKEGSAILRRGKTSQLNFLKLNYLFRLSLYTRLHFFNDIASFFSCRQPKLQAPVFIHKLNSCISLSPLQQTSFRVIKFRISYIHNELIRAPLIMPDILLSLVLLIFLNYRLKLRRIDIGSKADRGSFLATFRRLPSLKNAAYIGIILR
ncbi:hypothetical protein X992_5504 [Burkholderia pseudomallei MSHR5492]|nr:hypothetical protein X992_5504 [Burkholderia pseudomallei MSHR5492]